VSGADSMGDGGRTDPARRSDGPSGRPELPGSADEPIPDAYVVQRVGEALASDERVGELGLSVAREGDEVVVRGAVSTPARKAGVVPVAGEVVDALHAGLGVRDETDVPPAVAPGGEEVLR
jgi:hypothetical protein